MKQIILILLFSVTVISAQWSTDPASPQSLGSGIQAQLAATSDGGVYVAWLSDGNNYQVYLQRLNSSGEPQWDDNGMVVSNNDNATWIAVYHLNLAVDSEDNAIITTVDQRTGDTWEVYAYKLAPDGSMLWGVDGVALTASGVSNMSPRLTVLPDNSVVVTWTHDNNSVLLQRISSTGALLWDTGILIEDDDAIGVLSPKPIVTAEGDVLIQWIRQSGAYPWAPDSELYLQKYDLNGNSQWINPLVVVGPVQFPMGNWQQQSVADAENGSFSGWTEMSGNVQNAGVQHITGFGALSWTGGVDLSTNSSNFRISPQLAVAEDTQALMAVWGETNGTQSQHGVYAQRLDNSGNRLWGSNGTAVVPLNSDYVYLDLSIAGFGEDLITTYIQQLDYTNNDIYAARLDANGDYVWTGETVAVTNSGNLKSDMMVAKGLGCLFIAWTENGSIYTHCLLEDGTLGAPINALLVPSEYTTIQAAIDSADDGDMILVADGTYTGAGNKELTWDGTEKHITVKSENGPENCIIDLEDNGRAFTFVSGLGDNSIWITASDVIDGFTIRNGNTNDYAGAIYCYYGYENDVSPTIRNCVFENNTSNYGGAICIDGGSSLITNCVFDSNSANYGGAIYLGSAGGDTEPLIQQCTFTGNSADLHWNGQGGAIYLTNVSTNEDCQINNNTFDGNSAPNGGAIYFSTSSPEVRGNLFVNNTGSTNGSALYIGNYDGPTISNCTIANNTGSEAVYCYGFNGTVEPVFINTIIWDSDSSFGFQDTNQANPIISYCNLESGFPTTGTDGGGNISIDPLFCSPDSGDYTLAENSSCVAAGDNGSNLGAFGVGCGSIHIGPLWYVATTGSDATGNGTDTNPFATIQTAIDSSSDGDTVLVAAGTYVENVNFNGKNIAVIGEARETTIIDGDSSGSVVTFNSGEDSTTLFSGFSITNGSGNLNHNNELLVGGGIYVKESYPKLNDLHIFGNTAQGASAVYFYDWAYLKNSIIEDNSGGRWVISIQRVENSDPSGIIENVLIHNNTCDEGIITIWECYGGSISIVNTTLVNNISLNGGDFSAGISFETVETLYIRNSIIYDNSPANLYVNAPEGFPVTANISYCDIGGGQEEIVYAGNPIINFDYNIDANPLFCNPSGGDFLLGENSPCVGTGDNGANMGAFGVGCGIINQVINVPADYVTVQAAIDATIDGDTVLIHPGIYEGAYLFNKNINLFSLYSTTGDTSYISNTIIDGDDDGCPLMIYGNIDESTRISGFTIQNGTGCVYGQGGGLYIEGSPVVDNLVIKDNNALLNGGGICVNLNSSPTFRDLIVKNNTGELGAGIYVTGSTIDMQNCVISNNSANSKGGGVFIAHATSGTNLANVTITGNTAAESGGGIYCEDSSPSLVNSILWNNLPEEIYIYSDTVIVAYSDIQGGWEGTGNIDSDPLFCNPDSGDYALAENSPCVGTGYYGVNMGALGVGCGTYNFPPTDFSLSEPSNNAQITIDESNMNDGYITFSWGESSDANGDSLYYLVRSASAEIGDHGMDTNATSITVSYVDIIEDMSENNVTAATLEWTVHVTDGIDTVEADNAPFTIEIDGANALRTYLEGLLPDEFALRQNYPNPFNPITTLRYDLPENSYVNVTVYDMLGRKVKTLINQTQDAGYRSVIWDATNDYGKPISAGIYLYQIQAGGYTSTKKMVLLK